MDGLTRREGTPRGSRRQTSAVLTPAHRRRLLHAALALCVVGAVAVALRLPAGSNDREAGAEGAEQEACQPLPPDALVVTTTSLRLPSSPVPAWASMEEALASVGLPPPPPPGWPDPGFEVLATDQGARFRRVTISGDSFESTVAARNAGVVAAPPWQIGDEAASGTHGDLRFDTAELVLDGDMTAGGTITVRECTNGRTEVVLTVNVGVARLAPCSNSASLGDLCRAILGSYSSVSSFEPPWLTEGPTVAMLPDGRLQARVTLMRANATPVLAGVYERLLEDGWTSDMIPAEPRPTFDLPLTAQFRRTVAGIDVIADVQATPAASNEGSLTIEHTFTTADPVPG